MKAKKFLIYSELQDRHLSDMSKTEPSELQNFQINNMIIIDNNIEITEIPLVNKEEKE